MLKLKLQYFGHLMRRADSLEKTLVLEKIEGRRRRQKEEKAEGEEGGEGEDEMIGWHHQLYRHEFEQTLGDGEGQEGLACCSPWDRK